MKNLNEKETLKRPEEITKEFLYILDNHLDKIINGEEEEYLGIKDLANIMNIHPIHLSNTIKEKTGKSPCDICNEKTINVAKKLLSNSELKIVEIAKLLTFEPTNFTKYFKKHTGETPSLYRKIVLNKI
ncbi:AraC family transcriptional regulator [Chishuiella sp.]|uniref:helix-turn-helix domain-containing protein n=1 Tax=Chishuiella sp. TaxID=1969467 RepID=UPI0028AF1EA6|nr:AraC family transcriptional regulator [Chishuiella sp.]